MFFSIDFHKTNIVDRMRPKVWSLRQLQVSPGHSPRGGQPHVSRLRTGIHQ
jgi:hypothetical protein